MFFKFTETPSDHNVLRGVHYRALDSNNELKPLAFDGKPKKARLFISDENRKRGFWEISVVYYRTGYDPTNYEPNTEG